MKYLKLFESYSKDWWEITEEEFEEMIWGSESPVGRVTDPAYIEHYSNWAIDNWEELTDDEIEKIMSYYPDCEPSFVSLPVYWEINTPEVAKLIPKKARIMISKADEVGEDVLLICKSKDEWYYVSDETTLVTRYKADQIDGLLELLKHLTS